MSKNDSEITPSELMQIFEGQWTPHTDHVDIETHKQFTDRLSERYQEILDAKQSLDAKHTDGMMGELADMAQESKDALYEFIRRGAENAGEPDAIPDSQEAFENTSNEQQKEWFDEYKHAAIEEDSMEPYDLLHTIEKGQEVKDEEERIKSYYARWFDMIQLTIFYKGMVASYLGGYIPFRLARAVLEYHDPWWEGKTPKSEFLTMLGDTKD